MAMIDVNWNPTERQLRQFGALLALFGAIVGGLIYFKSGHLMLAASTFAVLATIGCCGVCYPRLIKPVYVVWMAAALPIGWLVSHAMLALVYYMIVTPIGLVMRLCGYDPAARKFDRDAESYWIPRPPEKDIQRYFRQY